MAQVPVSDIVSNTDAIVANLNDIIIIDRDILIAASGASSNGIQGTTGVDIHIAGTVVSTEAEAILLTNNNSITNEGTIAGATGIDFNSSGASINFLANTGTISALGVFGTAIVGGSGLELIVNSGTIVGVVQLGGGTDSFDGRGGHVISGFVDLGDGNDLGLGGDFGDSFSGGNGDDSVSGNGGNDTFNASSGADDGNDTFNGGDGTDGYSAQNASAAVTIDLDEGRATGTSIGLDTLINVEDATGSEFADFLFGNAGANSLFGVGGIDTLFGFAGNDTISGGDGNDIIVGGAGADFLTGGGDNDTFDYNALSDSGLTAATRDHILDFTSGDDRIDLSTLDANKLVKGNQAFNFVAGGFTKAGQVHAVAHGADTLVEINIDKDKAPEMTILLHGAIALSNGDFIL